MNEQHHFTRPLIKRAFQPDGKYQILCFLSDDYGHREPAAVTLLDDQVPLSVDLCASCLRRAVALLPEPSEQGVLL